MNSSRRQFCKLSLISAIAALFAPSRAFGSLSSTRPMRGRCRIEVIRCQCFQELQGRYLTDPEAGPCTHFSVGDTIEITPADLDTLKESGKICPNAWRALEPYVMAALSCHVTSECAPAEHETEAIVSCPDGTRPVIFKVTSL